VRRSAVGCEAIPGLRPCVWSFRRPDGWNGEPTENGGRGGRGGGASERVGRASMRMEDQRMRRMGKAKNGVAGRQRSLRSARTRTGSRLEAEHQHGECRNEPSPEMGEGSEGVARARGGARMVSPTAERAACCLPRSRSPR
jgi:hypothetical protein